MFQFSSNLFFWTVVNFVILVVIVHRFALPSLFKMIDESEKKKAELLAQIQANNAESTKLLSEYKSRLSSVDEEVKQILLQAKQDGEAHKKSQMEEAFKEKDRLLKELKSDLASERTQIVNDIRENALSLVVALTSKIIGKEVSKDAHYAIIQDDINEFGAIQK